MDAPAQPAANAKQSLVDARLRKHADYKRAYAASRKKQSASMSWFLAPRNCAAETSRTTAKLNPGAPRVGLTAGKVLGQSA